MVQHVVGDGRFIAKNVTRLVLLEAKIALVIVVEKRLLEIFAEGFQLIEVFAVGLIQWQNRFHDLTLILIIFHRSVDLFALQKVIRHARERVVLFVCPVLGDVPLDQFLHAWSGLFFVILKTFFNLIHVQVADQATAFHGAWKFLSQVIQQAGHGVGHLHIPVFYDSWLCDKFILFDDFGVRCPGAQ